LTSAATLNMQKPDMPILQEAPADPAAVDVEMLAREHYAAVYRFCARRVGVDLAADAAQEAFLTAQRAVGRFRGESRALTWLLGIANNECRRLARKHRLRPPEIELDPARHADSGDTESAIVNRNALQEALARLSAEHREVVILHEIEGLTYEEVAAVAGVPVGTVKSRLHHAMLHLRRALGGEERP
jgi:RNA polymerase sigma-70 factor, ECF subfamily